MNTRERKGHDATNITSAFAESCIQIPWPVMPILMRMGTGMTTGSVKTSIMKSSHSLNATDVHTHIMLSAVSSVQIALRQSSLLSFFQPVFSLLFSFEKTEQCRTPNRTRKECAVPPPKMPTQGHGLTSAEASFHNL